MSKEIYLFSTPSIYGGSEVFQIKLAELLHHHVCMVVVSPPLPPLKKGLLRWGARFIELPASSGLSLRYAFFAWLWRNRNMFQGAGPTIVLNGRGSAYWAPIVRLLTGHAAVVICHTELSLKNSDIKERLYGVSARFAQCVVTVSESVASQHRQRWPKISVQAIPNWIDGADAEKIRLEELGQGGSDMSLRVAVIGRLAPGKGIENVVAACAELQGVELHLFGDGPLRDRFTKMAEEMPWLHLHGHVDDLAQRLSGYSLLVSASYSESFSYAVAEGIQSGVLCVISDIPAHRELLGPDYPDALFFPPGNVGALKQSLQAAESLISEGGRAAAQEAVKQAKARMRVRNAPSAARKSYLQVLAGDQQNIRAL
jgi:glycosyltransferase involved in cell wall biosynthesis